VIAKALSSSVDAFHHPLYHQSNGKYNLMIKASDHGNPVPKDAKMSLQIIIQGATNNPPRFLEPVYYVNISENIPSGSFVIRVGAKSFQPDSSKLLFKFFFIFNFM